MKKAVCTTLVATQLMGVWFAVAQTNADSPTKQQQSVIQVNTSPAVAVRAGHTKPAIAVSPRSLDFASVAVNGTSNLTFTVQNVGGAILNGSAKVSAPFSIIAGAIYSLSSKQSQVITVQYAPKATGMNMTVVCLTGGGGTNITVAGSAVPAPPAAPAPPQNLHIVAMR